MKKRLVWLAFVLVFVPVLLFLLVSCNNKKSAAEAEAEKIPTVGLDLDDALTGYALIDFLYNTALGMGFEGDLQAFLTELKGADGRGVTSMRISDDGDLWVVFSSGEALDLGRVRADFDPSGIRGADGAGIAEVKFDESGSVLVTLTDGTAFVSGSLKGKDGRDGLTPTIGANGNWLIGGVDTGVKARGERGETGAKGEPGEKGADGKNGKDGVGIANLYIDGGKLWAVLTDGAKICVGDLPVQSGASENGGQANSQAAAGGVLSPSAKVRAGEYVELVLVPETFDKVRFEFSTGRVEYDLFAVDPGYSAEPVSLYGAPQTLTFSNTVEVYGATLLRVRFVAETGAMLTVTVGN